MPSAKAWASAALALLIIVVVACGGPPSSGIDGIVVTNQGGMITSKNQWSPLPLPGGFGTSTLRPFHVDAIQVLVASPPNTHKVVVARVQPDCRSLFSVKLPPGDYVLVPLDRATEGWEMVNGRRHLITGGLGQWPVTVQAGRWTRVVVSLMRH
jgi:hypothetical protein